MKTRLWTSLMILLWFVFVPFPSEKGIAAGKSAVPAIEVRMTKWKKIALIAVGALAVLILFTATILPVLVRNKAIEVLREATGRNVRIEKVSLLST